MGAPVEEEEPGALAGDPRRGSVLLAALCKKYCAEHASIGMFVIFIEKKKNLKVYNHFNIKAGFTYMRLGCVFNHIRFS